MCGVYVWCLCQEPGLLRLLLLQGQFWRTQKQFNRYTCVLKTHTYQPLLAHGLAQRLQPAKVQLHVMLVYGSTNRHVHTISRRTARQIHIHTYIQNAPRPPGRDRR